MNRGHVLLVTVVVCVGFMGVVMLVTPTRKVDPVAPSPAHGGKITGKGHVDGTITTIKSGKVDVPVQQPECWQIIYLAPDGRHTVCVPHEQWTKLDIGQMYQP